ncbi:7811_t:CDS:2 [Cetraspora pellucida]|uniref:7811_t:CDS:1 n=1 Tax=Cetraspora pellucida TaxID=1433469 RepID=A0ACA9LJL7_9GLOM|nr:7811_t:CDS:2 [Cetraspora pellucida]
MSQTNVNNENHNKFDNLEEELSEISQNEADKVANQVFKDFVLSVILISHNEISKKCLLKTLSISYIAFEQAANLHIELQFEH